jgi:hypothetical protein
MSTNLFFVLLLIGVIAMVIGPIMMLQPTSLQRRQEQLRSRAIELGLRVKVTSLPRQATDLEAPEAIPMYYFSPPQEREERDGQKQGGTWLLFRGAYEHETNFIGHWMWHGTGRAGSVEQAKLRYLLPQLPASVLAVGKSPEGVSVYWTEAGGVPTLEQLAQRLKEFASV